MGKITTFRKVNGEKEQIAHPLAKPSKGYVENLLTPVTLSGVVIPWKKEFGSTKESDFKLACASGLEYLFVSDAEWRSVLAWYSWEEVKVIGLLNAANMTLIPQRVFPKGPKGEKENVIDLALWKSRETLKKIVKNVNDLVVIPAAVWAVAGFRTI